MERGREGERALFMGQKERTSNDIISRMLHHAMIVEILLKICAQCSIHCWSLKTQICLLFCQLKLQMDTIYRTCTHFIKHILKRKQYVCGMISVRFFRPVSADIFSQISDSSGTMVFAKFDQFLREVLKLPTAVFEGPSFGYTEHSVRTCFPQQVTRFPELSMNFKL